MMKFAAVAAATFVLLAAGAAQAVTTEEITFFFGGGDGDKVDSLVFEEHGVALTVKPGLFSNDGETIETPSDAKVGHWSTGLGVSNGRSRDSHLVDGVNGNDVLLLHFNHPVKVVAASFSYVYRYENDYSGGVDDVFSFFAEGNDGTEDFGLDAFGPLKGNRYGFDFYEFQQHWFGDSFGIGAKNDKDGFKLKALHIEKITPIPLPAAGAALALGLAAFGVLAAGRRRETLARRSAF